jgi:hypothetical protein
MRFDDVATCKDSVRMQNRVKEKNGELDFSNQNLYYDERENHHPEPQKNNSHVLF